MRPILVAVLASLALPALTSCGSGDSTPGPGGHRVVRRYPEGELTRSDRRAIRTVILRAPDVRDIAGASRIEVERVIPWTSGWNQGLIGAVVEIALTPPVSFENKRLPGVVSPNRHAPPGTPFLRREWVVSAHDVGKLEVSVELRTKRVVSVAPYEGITKARLLGPEPPADDYGPEPGE